MIKQFRIPFELKTGSSVLTFRARHVPNAPEACLEARWRYCQFAKMGRTFSLKMYSLDRTRPEQGRKFVEIFWKMQMFLPKWLTGRFSQICGYESRESGREIIPGMHIWTQLGIWGGVGVGQISPPISLLRPY